MHFKQENTDRFQKEITPEELELLPLNFFQGEIVVVDKLTQLPEAIDYLSNEEILGLDTETRPSFRKGEYHPIALIQIAAASKVFLFRTNLIGFPESLRRLLENKHIVKVGIGLDNDLPELKKLHRFSPAGFIDLNKELPPMGFINTGAKKLTAIILGFRLSKTKQTSNWEADVFSPGQLAYAATDAWVCREMYLRLCGIA